MNIYEKIYEKKHLNKILHTTLNPDDPGVVRIHLVPSKYSLFIMLLTSLLLIFNI